MLKLKPSLKTARRYILVSGNRKEIEKAILDYIGILGWAKAEPFFVKKIKKGQILSVNRKEIDRIIGSFAIAADKIEVLKISGTLKGMGVQSKRKT